MITGMICGASLLRSTHFCNIACSLFHIFSPLGHWNICIVSSARCPHPLGQVGLGHTPLFTLPCLWVIFWTQVWMPISVCTLVLPL